MGEQRFVNEYHKVALDALQLLRLNEVITHAEYERISKRLAKMCARRLKADAQDWPPRERVR